MKPTLYHNGRIWGLDASTNTSHKSDRGDVYDNWMIVLPDGRIEAMGKGSPPAFLQDEHAIETTVDLHQQLVFPGLQDAHLHVYFLGETAHYVDLVDCHSLQDLQARLVAHEAAYPENDWVIGFGWEQDKLKELDPVTGEIRYPTRYDLDQVLPTKPAILFRVCWHIAVVNTAAFKKASIDLTQKNWHIPGGAVDVDATGPSGILREEATQLVQKHVAESSNEIRKGYLKNALQKCVNAGLTGVHTNDHNCFRLYQELQQENELPIRVYLTPDASEIGNPNIPPPGTRDGNITCDRVKIFSDGSLGAETAALREPYVGSSNYGILYDSDKEMTEKVRQAHANGYRVEVHAIGDRAVAQVLNAFQKAGIRSTDRPIITHCQILGPDLLKRMHELGVIANIQPSFAVTDATYVNKRIKEDLLPFSYCWKTMLEHGITCAGGSDAPIESYNPFQGIYDAMFRQSATQTKPFFPQERLSFCEAVQLYTRHAAYAAKEERNLGVLAPGYLADFVLLKHDIVADPSLLVAPDLVEKVWVGGKCAFTRSEGDVSIPTSHPTSTLPGKNGPSIRICHCC